MFEWIEYLENGLISLLKLQNTLATGMNGYFPFSVGYSMKNFCKTEVISCVLTISNSSKYVEFDLWK
jgi:hypothetical protein